MKTRHTSLVLAFIFAFSQSVSAAAVPAVPSLVLPAADAAKIGVVAAFKGAVTIQKPGEVGRIVQSGEPIYLGDTISTDADSNLQILLLDETVFTIGPSSAIIIDKFVYDPATEAGKVNAKVVKGVFRFVTGKIARKKPDDMKVELPSGTIGIRGTIVTGKVDGMRSTVILLGPGAQTNTNHRIGQIVVSNPVGNEVRQVRVVRPGFGTVIEGEQVPPVQPFKVPVEQLQDITSQLEPPVTRSPGGGNEPGEENFEGSPTNQAGQNKAGAKGPLGQFGKSGRLAQKLSSEIEKASQSEATSTRIRDGIARFDDLRRIQTGVFNYTQLNVTLLRNGGPSSGKHYDFYYEIDFGARRAGGNGTKSRIDATLDSGNPTYLLPEHNFSSGSDLASFSDNVNFSSGTCSSCSGPATIRVNLVNQDGEPGLVAAHTFSQVDAGNTLSGGGVTDPRVSS